MNSIVLAAILIGAAPSASDYYSGAVKRPTAADYYTPLTPTPTIQKEEEDEIEADVKPVVASVDRRRVYVYVDLQDVKSLRRIVDEFDRVQGLEFILKDKSEVPIEGSQFKLPLIHFSTGAGSWGFRSGWNGPDEFAAYWGRHNKDIQQDKGVQIGQSKARVQKPQLQRSAGSGYHAHSYEWHLVSGESAASLRNHLAVQQPEHQKGAYFDRAWLNTLGFHELVGLHSDAHNRRVQWGQVPGRQLASTSQPERKSRSQTKEGGGLFWMFLPRQRSSGGCPGGVCPK